MYDSRREMIRPGWARPGNRGAFSFLSTAAFSDQYRDRYTHARTHEHTHTHTHTHGAEAAAAAGGGKSPFTSVPLRASEKESQPLA